MIMSDNSTIVIRSKTRDLLKHIGRKEQTYDQLINELIDSLGNQKELEDSKS
jgi:hypothetical protein